MHGYTLVPKMGTVNKKTALPDADVVVGHEFNKEKAGQIVVKCPAVWN